MELKPKNLTLMSILPRRPHLLFLVVLAVFGFSLTIGPRVADRDQNKYCVVNVHLIGPFGVTLNCDTQQFLRLATDFSAIYEPDSIRQSRPGLIYIASLVAKPLVPLSEITFNLLKPAAKHPDIPQERLNLGLRAFIPAYIAYILINFALMVGTFHLLWHIVRDAVGTASASSLGAFGAGLLLIFNDVVKGFLLSPHSQLFNIFVPTLCLWVFHQTWVNNLFYRPGMFVLAIGTAIGFASYAPFALVAPCMFVPAAVQAWRNRHKPGLIWHSVLRALIFLAIMVAPNTLWYLHVKNVTHGFYVVEVVKYRLFIWMFDVYQAEGAFSVFLQLLHNIAILTGQAMIHALPAIAIAAIAFGWVKAAGVSLRELTARLAPLICGAALVSSLFLVFYTTAGRITPRLAIAAAPPVIVLASTILGQAQARLPGIASRGLSLTAFLLSLGYGIWTAAKFGPYYTWGQ